jgi:deoxyribonuclease V
LGVILDRPPICCARSRLVGHYEEPERVFGAHTLLDGGEAVCTAVPTRRRHEPLFVSPGHKLSVEMAIDVTLVCCRNGAFLLVPSRLAHEIISGERKRVLADA